MCFPISSVDAMEGFYDKNTLTLTDYKWNHIAFIRDPAWPNAGIVATGAVDDASDIKRGENQMGNEDIEKELGTLRAAHSQLEKEFETQKAAQVTLEAKHADASEKIGAVTKERDDFKETIDKADEKVREVAIAALMKLDEKIEDRLGVKIEDLSTDEINRAASLLVAPDKEAPASEIAEETAAEKPGEPEKFLRGLTIGEKLVAADGSITWET